MRLVRRPDLILLSLAAVVVTACGGDDPTGPEGPAPNFVLLQSDPGDYIGGGESYEYTQADAVISVTATGGRLSIGIDGDESWGGEFQSPSGLTRIQPGTYASLARYPFHDPADGGLSWSGEGRGCNTLSGQFTVDAVTYDGANLTAIDLRFEQHCENGAPALRGTIHWRSDDPTSPPGPINPVPAGVWRPAPGATPSAGDYVYLTSDAGDYIGAGQTITYTPTNATIGVSASGGHLSVTVDGADWWFGDFQTMNTISRLQLGYYGDLRRFPFHNPVKGGLNWSGEGRGCNTLVGWFAVDRATYTNGTLTGLDLRFEQHCEGATAALRGAIHWDG